MNGWRYEWVQELPPEIHAVIVEMINREAQARDEARGGG